MIIPPTINGYNYLDVVSAFQKSIRRSDEEVALFFGIEIELSNRDEALWRRLKVITSEDVGLANPNAIVIIESLHNSYREAKKQKKTSNPQRLMLIHAILFLCRSPKSRLVDWALNACYPLHNFNLINIPEYAYDMHTKKGKSMGKDLAHFAKEGALLINHDKQKNEDFYMEKALKALRK